MHTAILVILMAKERAWIPGILFVLFLPYVNKNTAVFCFENNQENFLEGEYP